MNSGLKKWFSRKTKKELIELCYQLHLENMQLTDAINIGVEEEC